MIRTMLVLSAMAALSLTPTDAAAPTPRLAGVWVASGLDRPAFSGTITIERSRDGWTANAGGARASGRPEHGGNAFRFPGNIGALWTPLLTSKSLTGMWEQPGSAIDSNAYATPVTLRGRGSDSWAGVVAPFVPRYQLYANFITATDGSLHGFLRDPIGDFGTMAPFDTVTTVGDSVTIRTRAHTFHGTIDTSADTLRLAIGTGPPMLFRRLDPNTPNGFYPLPAHARLSFGAPVVHGDGWKVGTPTSVAIDNSKLGRLAAFLAAQNPTSPGTPYIQSVLIARNDRLVSEQYYYGFDRTRPHDVRSAGKSLDAALFGAAALVAPALSVDTPANSLLNYQDLAHPDARKSQITVGNFLDMTSGLDCDENNDSSLGNEDTMQSQTTQSDWYRYIMDLPMVHDPGGLSAVYCSGGMNMTGAFIAGATHRWTPEFFDAVIARPLQFGEYHLQLTPTDEMYLGGGSYFLP
ncbi:MAG: serine hydrolase, partial [Candidatus Eremiobacteraeota bacterium]|nr:serine hydrolase [Candidatus Eremiobacteraeota bacterium]